MPDVIEGGDGTATASIKSNTRIDGEVKILRAIDLVSPALCTVFSEDGKKMAVGLSNGNIMIFQTSDGVPIYQLSDERTKKDKQAVTSVQFIPQDISSRGELLLASYANGLVRCWHVSSQTAIHTVDELRQTLTCSISSGFHRFTTGGNTEDLFVYDLHSGKKVKTCHASPQRDMMDGHRLRVLCVKHHPFDENVFVSGGWDDTVQMWDAREDHATRRIYGPHICGGDGIDIDGHYNHLLTSSWRKDKTLQVWDFNTGSPIKGVPADFSVNSLLYCGQFMGKDHMVCGGSDNNMIRIIDRTSLATTGLISNLPSGVYGIDHIGGKSSSAVICAAVGDQVLLLTNSTSSNQLQQQDGA